MMWWEDERKLTVEEERLLRTGPLHETITAPIRLYAMALWRCLEDERERTQYEWAEQMGVDRRTIIRWDKILEAANMIQWKRPTWVLGPDGYRPIPGRPLVSDYVPLHQSFWLFTIDSRPATYRGASNGWQMGWQDEEGEVVRTWPRKVAGKRGRPRKHQDDAARRRAHEESRPPRPRPSGWARRQAPTK